MKANIKIITVFFVLMTSCVIFPRQTSAQESNISFQVFYDQLSPYGQWIDYTDYGYVWIPDAGSEFVPYSTDGHWILTDYGWTWASDYDWGWAVFHYGRWSYSDSFGWFWVPDTEWGPAWVNWRQAEGYYGWSPMEPGVTLSMSFGRAYDSHNDHWMFVRDRDIEQSDVHNYYVNRADHDRIARNSTVINNTFLDNNRHTTYVSGPSRVQVQKVTGRNINPVVVRENNKPGQTLSNGQYRIYRPQVQKNNSGARKSVPTRVTNVNELKRTPATNSSNQNKIGSPVNRVVREPVKTVEPGKNNSQPYQQRNTNQQDTRQVQPNSISIPSNSNRNIQPAQAPLSNPGNINRPIRKPDAVTPQNNNQQPVRQPNVIRQNNNVQPVQPKEAAPQNNQQPVQRRNVAPENAPQPAQQRIMTPQPAQQRNGSPQNDNSQPVQRRNVDAQNKIVQPPQQPRNVAPQSPNPGQGTASPAQVNRKTQPGQPQNINQGKNRPAKQQKSIKQEVKKEQEKTPDAVTDRK